MAEKKVVVIGGGFAGSLVAKKLESYFDVTLIDSKEYFEFTPGILRSIIKPKHLKKIQACHSSYLKKARFISGYVKEISREYIKVNKRKIKYNYLIICSGSKYDPPMKEQGVKIISRFNNIGNINKKLLKAKRVLIIGGGLVGVELTGEICTHFKDKEITLAYSGDRLMYKNNVKSALYTEKFFKKNNVKLLNERIEGFKSGEFISEGGKKIKADVAFFCTGIKPNSELMRKNFFKCINEEGYIKVNEYLQVIGEKNIFVVGDVNDVKENKTAQNARRQAKFIVKNLKAIELGKKLIKYTPKNTLLVISLGKYNGIFEWKNFSFFGKIPALMKGLIEKGIMLRYGKI